MLVRRSIKPLTISSRRTKDEDFDMVSQHSSIFSSRTSLMAQGATADCVLLVGGRRLYAHKVVVSKRCGKLRDLIYEEHREGEVRMGLGTQS